MGNLDYKVFSIAIFTISALMISGTVQYASAGAGVICDDLMVTDGDAFIEWTCEDLTEFSFYGIDHLDETEVHICLESEDECSLTNLDEDIHNEAMEYISGSANEDANTITLVYEQNDVQVEIVYTLEQISATVAQVTHDYTISLVDVFEGSMFDSIKFIHTTDAEVDDEENDTIQFDAASKTLVYTGESGIRYEVESQDPIDWVGICDQNDEGDECELDDQPTAGHLTLPSDEDFMDWFMTDWGTGLQYNFDLDYEGPQEVSLQVIERIVLPSVSTTGDTYVVMGSCCDSEGNDGPQDGSLAQADLNTGELTQRGGDLANEINEGGGLSGLAIDSFGRFYVTAVDCGFCGDASGLARVDENGILLDNIGETVIFSDEDDEEEEGPVIMNVNLRDLSFEPETDILFGAGRVDEGSSNALFIVNTIDATLEMLGPIEGTGTIRGIAFDPTDGTLYGVNCSLYTIDPSDPSITSLVTELHRCYDGLGIDSDGQIFATDEGDDSLHLIDPTDGSDITVAGEGLNPSDVDFIVPKEVKEVHCDTEFEWALTAPTTGERGGSGHCVITYADGSESDPVQVEVSGDFTTDPTDFPLVGLAGTFHMDASGGEEIDAIWIDELGTVDYDAVSEEFADFETDTVGTAESMGIFGDLSTCDVETMGAGVGLFSSSDFSETPTTRTIWIVCPDVVSGESGLGSPPAKNPTLGVTRNGILAQTNGFCFDQFCMDVLNFFNHLPIQEVNSQSTHTISLTAYCPSGASRCNYASVGGAPPGTDINSAEWNLVLKRIGLSDQWELIEYDSNNMLGIVTATAQVVDSWRLQFSFTIQFLTPASIGTAEDGAEPPLDNLILVTSLRESGGGSSTNIFNDGILVNDYYAYPQVETIMEPSIEYEQLCLNEDSTKRHTCAFDKVKDWTIKNAEAKLKEIYNPSN